MLAYLGRRLAQLVPVLLLISLIVFLILHALPGDPAMLMLAGAEGGAVSAERIAELQEAMGLNDPLPVQYGRFLLGILRGDLGESIRLRTPVTEVILERFAFTIQLSLGGLACALLLGITTGVLSALRPNGWTDVLFSLMAYFGMSMPLFWLGLMLIFLFAFQLKWFPPSGSEGLDRLILPSLTLGFVSAGAISRLTRSSLMEVLHEDYIRTAQAKGLARHRIVQRHALKNALIPVVTIVGLQFGGMLAGAVVTETVFSRPGLGRLVVQAILWKDYPLAQGIILFMAVLFLSANLLVDISYAWLDPRIRFH
ncbi:MAG: ABC transporter permease [Caldilineaceae bacterium SB0662_bin_9]|uniref:Nickel import system permease protein NikB n=1 Tax=Caldilineaceae bacterium SB0662_bin_9 TaxID=2605258 RepID=A0A6B1DN20_9CHLR|nr:ABC transporter permease [Caldilineaceae bacterium SB0662_bin_9]